MIKVAYSTYINKGTACKSVINDKKFLEKKDYLYAEEVAL